MTKSKKIRADQALVKQGLVESRSRAQALILAGKVLLDTKRIDKAGELIPNDAVLSLKEKDHPWVSRGGLKLEKGLSHFDVNPEDAIALDIGASTGGFTDVLLSRGAARVYAVDVGHGQLDWKIRTDDRVVVLERTNARNLDKSLIPEPIDILVCDASFISLKTVLPAGMALVKPGGWLIALIKPQFEVGKEQVGKKGVVRDQSLHQAVCDDISSWLANDMGWLVQGIVQSPIKGPEGNVEFLIGAQNA